MMKQSKYNINILNVWGDEIDLYVDFIIENKETNEFAHCCDWYDKSVNKIDREWLKRQLYNNPEQYFKIPKTSELNYITYNIFKDLCQSENDMLWIDDKDAKEDYEIYLNNNLEKLKTDIKKFHLEDYFDIDINNNITVYGGLQTVFNDDISLKELDKYKIKGDDMENEL